ncbi:MBL fold metallo-hydrolase [Pseudomonas citronellolis]|uniref:MBL fold metallo-hydrolase n=1 Tax=Pseudomonas citronellolis TaxID=53408 RepID=UPI0023E45E74|nr:MBL fold metallo-hydrolase [Pseudomonas citronellolis]MDF3931161.1 MBL fold metallo-hydrolase [Pseudomonas citronellolis]
MPLKIADRWFERRHLGDGITLLWEPHVHPMLRCNIWHVRGRERDLLVDTGMGVASLRDAARDLFERPLLTVATHCHLDHMGGLHEFDCRLCHPAEAADFREPEADVRLALAEDHWLAEYMGDLDASRLVIDALPHEGFDPAGWRLRAAPPTGLLEEGGVLDLGDRQFEVLHLPGHSPGSIGLLEHGSGTLFSGDAIYDAELLDRIPGADIPTYRRTMQRLRELPVTVVHAGHEASFGRERLRQLAEVYLAATG